MGNLSYRRLRFEAGLTLERIQEWREQLKKKQVSVFLPKFKFPTSYNLAQTLSIMGMGDAFSNNTADFSGMTGNMDFYIKQVFHKYIFERMY